MRKDYLILIVALSFALPCNPAAAQNSDDPGASGVIDGSDVRQFLDSGPRFNPTRMEEASRRFDKMIKMPPRLRRAKNWDEVIRRDNKQFNEHVGESIKRSDTKTTGDTTGKQKPQAHTSAKNTERHHLLKKVGRALEETAEVVGFPISDEFLPNDVDASLAGDLPDGKDPRRYVHRKISAKEAQARKEFIDRAETRGASAEDIIPQGNGQPPALIVK